MTPSPMMLSSTPSSMGTALLLLLAFLTPPTHAVRRLPNNEASANSVIETFLHNLQQHEEHPHDQGRRLTNDLRGHHNDRNDAHRSTADITDPNAHLVTSLPLLPPGLFPTRHWAGHVSASNDDNGSDKKLFYWLFEPSTGSGDSFSEEDDKIPLVIWLDGGPGCSSMDGLWLENGPFRLNNKQGAGDWTIDVNPFSWHNAPAWVLYVDQPVGTGLSFTKKGNYCKSDFEIDRDFHYFLEEFFLLHKDKFLSPYAPTDGSPAQWILRRPFFFSGESHAGHYIPSMMDFILRRNDGAMSELESSQLSPLRVSIPCSGAAIGNGWTDPYYQYAAADAAYGAGIIGMSQRASLQEKEMQCQSNLKAGKLDSSVCFGLLDKIIDSSHGKNGGTVVSQYDTRKWEQKGQARTFPLGHKDVETYLGGVTSRSHPPLVVNVNDVLQAIHALDAAAAHQTYRECTDPPYLALSHQDGLGVVDELVRVLDHTSKPQMLFFNGINDLICNHVGNERFLDALPWSKTMQYMLQARHAWDAEVDPATKVNYVQGRPDGYVKQFENLTFLKVMESGHMVPMDQPSISLAMMQTLLYRVNESSNGFLTSMQILDRANTKKDGDMCLLDDCPNCVPIANSMEVVSPAPGGFFSPFSLASIGIMVAAFVSGILLSCMCSRRQTNRKGPHELVGGDLELSDVDMTYRDRPKNGVYS